MLRFLCLTIIIYSIMINSSFAQGEGLLSQLVREASDSFQHIIYNPAYEVQIFYTTINRDKANKPHFVPYGSGLNPNKYFYPASTVKMPTAFMALEKLNKLSIISLDKNTPMLIQKGHTPQTEALNDSTVSTLLPSIAHYIKKIFTVSDNDANNRLYEFLGQQYLNQKLHQKGFKNSRIIHRLGSEGSAFDPETNKYTNPISFIQNNELVYHQGEVYSAFDTSLVQPQKQQKGIAYVSKTDSLIHQPFDFSTKNAVSLIDLHKMLLAVLFPESVEPSKRFNLTEEDYRFLYKTMSMLPKESGIIDYKEKPDNYVKFFLFGDKDESFEIPSNIRIFNKVGWAYGFLTETAYVVDFEKNIEFMLSATIHVNKNQTYNDNKYEYESVGLPFLAELGRIIYNYEIRRHREYSPDLSRFKIEKYD